MKISKDILVKAAIIGGTVLVSSIAQGFMQKLAERRIHEITGDGVDYDEFPKVYAEDTEDEPIDITEAKQNDTEEEDS